MAPNRPAVQHHQTEREKEKQRERIKERKSWREIGSEKIKSRVDLFSNFPISFSLILTSQRVHRTSTWRRKDISLLLFFFSTLFFYSIDISATKCGTCVSWYWPSLPLSLSFSLSLQSSFPLFSFKKRRRRNAFLLPSTSTDISSCPWVLKDALVGSSLPVALGFLHLLLSFPFSFEWRSLLKYLR